MTTVILGSLWSVVAIAVFAAIFVVPGVWLARRLAPSGSVAAVGVLAVLLSLLLNAAVTAALLMTASYDPRLVALVAIVASVVSFPTLIRLLTTISPRRTAIVGLCAAIAVAPWVLAVMRLDFAPANTLQWYYWNVGQGLTEAGRIPATVHEFGVPIRWLPDYLFFNGLSETYSVLMAPAGHATAMQVWRVPLALAGLGAIYLVARLWLRRLPAAIAVAAVGASLFFVMKFNAYKPESLGIVVGLLAAWLIVVGHRERRPSWMLIGGGALGVDVAIHAIAATVAGMVVFAAATADLVTSRADRRRSVAMLTATAAVLLAVVVGTGVTLQGRALVATDALRPATGRAVDPTWTYLQYSNGEFASERPPSRSTRLAAGVRMPWPGIQLRLPEGLWLLWLAGLGIVFAALFGDRRVRVGLLAGVIGGVTLGAGIAFFAVGFSTYVPQHTGLVRLAQYIPGGVGLALGFAFQGYLLLWQRITGSGPGRVYASVAATVALLCMALAVRETYRSDGGIPAEGRAALVELARYAEQGDIVLSNALTTGQLEFSTDVEAPLEGRQPLIEQPAFLDQANAMLLAAHQYFGPERDDAVLDALDVRWVLVADWPGLLGAGSSLGGTVADANRDPRLAPRWQGNGVGLFEVITTNGPVTGLLRTTAP